MTTVIDARAGSANHAHGVLFMHAVPSAMASHVEWTLGTLFRQSISIDWAPQPIAPGHVRAEVIWSGQPGTAAKVASALLGFPRVRFEVTEDARGEREGERYAATPTLGLFRAGIGPHGDVMIHENRLRALLQQQAESVEAMAEEIDRLLGTPWDHELEPFRASHESSTVRVLHDVI